MPNPALLRPCVCRLKIRISSLLADTLESLDLPARGQFLQRYFVAITHLDLREVSAFNFGMR